jgi:hypothetical protein
MKRWMSLVHLSGWDRHWTWNRMHELSSTPPAGWSWWVGWKMSDWIIVWMTSGLLDDVPSSASFVIRADFSISFAGVHTQSCSNEFHVKGIQPLVTSWHVALFPGCPTCHPIRRVSKGARWIARPAARVMATASCGHRPSSTIIDVEGYRITTFKEPRSRHRHHPCTLPYLNWPVM